MNYFPEIPALYDIARITSHEFGLPWTDPRTGKTHQPPQKPRKAKRKTKRSRK